jgi:acyl-CoA dehydrogenase family protein 9
MTRWASSRKQFGVAIGMFELIQEKLATARVDTFVAGAMVDFAARQLEHDPTANVAMETSHCKLFATTRAWHTLYEAMQVAGGSGYLASNPYEKRMRDYRVATIFEGTTEIHSIYPATLLLRALGEGLPQGRAAQARALFQGMLRPLRWPRSSGSPLQRRTERAARWCVRAVRVVSHLGLLLHGTGIGKREYVLRRITWLSAYAFGLLAGAARVRTLRAAGRDAEAGELLLLGFLHEIRERFWSLCRPWNSRRERLLGRIARRS